ncbi:MAG: hypothetical protein GX189_05935 [Clostridiales bacterium]|nr:hypothetical protein [Clostridiales bacterium]
MTGVWAYYRRVGTICLTTTAGAAPHGYWFFCAARGRLQGVLVLFNHLFEQLNENCKINHNAIFTKLKVNVRIVTDLTGNFCTSKNVSIRPAGLKLKGETDESHGYSQSAHGI